MQCVRCSQCRSKERTFSGSNAWQQPALTSHSSPSLLLHCSAAHLKRDHHRAIVARLYPRQILEATTNLSHPPCRQRRCPSVAGIRHLEVDSFWQAVPGNIRREVTSQPPSLSTTSSLSSPQSPLVPIARYDLSQSFPVRFFLRFY